MCTLLVENSASALISSVGSYICLKYDLTCRASDAIEGNRLGRKVLIPIRTVGRVESCRCPGATAAKKYTISQEGGRTVVFVSYHRLVRRSVRTRAEKHRGKTIIHE